MGPWTGQAGPGRLAQARGSGDQGKEGDTLCTACRGRYVVGPTSCSKEHELVAAATSVGPMKRARPLAWLLAAGLFVACVGCSSGDGWSDEEFADLIDRCPDGGSGWWTFEGGSVGCREGVIALDGECPYREVVAALSAGSRSECVGRVLQESFG